MSLLHALNELLATNSGRDKVAKLLQYSSRIAVWYYAGRPRAKQAAALKTLMGDVRRFGYLFGSLQVYPSLAKDIAVTKPLSLSWILQTTADLCDFGYFLCDNGTFLADFGIIPMRQRTNNMLYNELGPRLWFLSTVCWTVLEIQGLRQLQADRKMDRKTKEYRLKQSELSLVNTGGNLLIAYFFLWPENRFITSPVAGALGVVGALAGLYARMIPAPELTKETP